MKNKSKSIPIVDYHMHTHLCGHAEGLPEDYVKHAISLGLAEIGFSDHAPLFSHRDPTITMDFKDLPLYQSMIEGVKRRYQKEISIKIGIETDFLPDYQEQTRALMQEYLYDYVIGSVHFLQGWGFDNPTELKEWQHHDIDLVYELFYEHLRMSAQSKIFDIIGHADLVKKFGHRPKSNLRDEIVKTAEVFHETGIVIEINTAGLRKPVKEIYPSLEVLSIYCQHKVPITFGSDAHRADEVGKDFDQAFLLAKAAGYKEYVSFKQRKIERTIALV